MKINLNCLNRFFETNLPDIDSVEEALSLHSFETEIVDGDLEVDVLPNRSSDSLSYYGIAKELSTALSLKLKENIIEETQRQTPFGTGLSISVEDDSCARYMAALIKGVGKPNVPKEIIECIERSGLNSVNPIVDITNYVMLELGLPLHAFDADKLKPNSDRVINISVRRGKSEKVKLLKTEEEYDVSNALLITDGNSKTPIAIAGIKGLETASISESTDNIVLEAAVFEQSNIRKTSKDLKLSTDASIRYSQNLSQSKAEYALSRAIDLIRKYCDGAKVEAVVDVGGGVQNKYKVGISSREIGEYMGFKVDDSEVRNIFKKLNFEYKEVNPKEEVVKLAKQNIGKEYVYGASVTKDAPLKFDCSSLVVYCYLHAGYQLPRVSIDQYLYTKPINENELEPGDLIFFVRGSGEKHTKPLNDFFYHISGEVKDGVNHVVLFVGDNKVIGAEYVSINKVAELNLDEMIKKHTPVGYRRVIHKEDKNRFVITSPSDRLDIRQKEDLIEEFARIYGYNEIPSLDLLPGKGKVNDEFYLQQEILEICKELGFSEIKTSSFSKEGDIEVKEPKSQDKPKLRNNLSSFMSEALDLNISNAPLLGITQVRLVEIGTVFLKGKEEMRMCVGIKSLKEHKSQGGQSADTVFERLIDNLNKKFNLSLKDSLKDGIWESNINWEFKAKEEYPVYEISNSKLESFSKYPFVVRDISVFVPSNIDSEDLKNFIKENVGEHIVRIDQFDEYKKDEKVSYAYRIIFQSDSRTLTDEEVNTVMDNLYKKLEAKKYEIR